MTFGTVNTVVLLNSSLTMAIPERSVREGLVPLALWAALLVPVAMTFGYAYLPHAPAKPVVSLAIAATKALLIATFFMQLREAAWLVRLAAIAGWCG